MCVKDPLTVMVGKEFGLTPPEKKDRENETYSIV